jgi:hypothetical protein
MGQAPDNVVTPEGFVLYRNIAAEHRGQRSGDPWTEHWSLSMAAPTAAHQQEVAANCQAAGVSCQFDKIGRLKVNSAKHQQQLADAIFGKGKVSNHDRYY